MDSCLCLTCAVKPPDDFCFEYMKYQDHGYLMPTGAVEMAPCGSYRPTAEATERLLEETRQELLEIYVELPLWMKGFIQGYMWVCRQVRRVTVWQAKREFKRETR